MKDKQNISLASMYDIPMKFSCYCNTYRSSSVVMCCS